MPETTTNDRLREGIAHLRGLLGELGDAVEEAESLRQLLTEAEGRVCRVQDQLAAFGLDPALIALGGAAAPPIPFHGADLPFHAGSTADAVPAPNETAPVPASRTGAVPPPGPARPEPGGEMDAPKHADGRRCTGCGQPITRFSKTGMCMPCVNAAGALLPDGTPVTLPPTPTNCQTCGGPLSSVNKSGFCQKHWPAEQKRRQAAGGGAVAKPANCSECGGAISKASTSGLCRSCSDRTRFGTAPAAPGGTPGETPAASRSCSGCGKPIGPKAKTGMCRGCAGAASSRERGALRAGLPPTPPAVLSSPPPSDDRLQRLVFAGRSAAINDPEAIAQRCAVLYLIDEGHGWETRHVFDRGAIPTGGVYLETLTLSANGRDWLAAHGAEAPVPVGRVQLDDFLSLLTSRVVMKDPNDAMIEGGELPTFFAEAHGIETGSEEVRHAAAA